MHMLRSNASRYRPFVKMHGASLSHLIGMDVRTKPQLNTGFGEQIEGKGYTNSRPKSNLGIKRVPFLV